MKFVPELRDERAANQALSDTMRLRALHGDMVGGMTRDATMHYMKRKDPEQIRLDKRFWFRMGRSVIRELRTMDYHDVQTPTLLKLLTSYRANARKCLFLLSTVGVK